MKNTKRALLLGIVFSLLLGQGLVGTQPSYAHRMIDCEVQRFSDFLDANSQYTSTFRSWRLGVPVSCQQECELACSEISNSLQRLQCISNCSSDCDVSRYATFSSAQDSMMDVASRSCDYNPDVCGEARWRRDLCNAAQAAQMENPVYDENGNLDGYWMYYVFQEYMACRAASGIDQCE